MAHRNDEKYTIEFRNNHEYDIHIEYDYEEDNIKIFHHATCCETGETTMLDVSPYEEGEDVIYEMCVFHDAFGYFPTSNMVDEYKLTAENVKKLIDLANNHQFPSKGEIKNYES